MNNLKKLIAPSMPAWPKLRPMCERSGCAEHTAGTRHEKQKGCEDVLLKALWALGDQGSEAQAQA